jgi:protein SCO1/2
MQHTFKIRSSSRKGARTAAVVLGVCLAWQVVAAQQPAPAPTVTEGMSSYSNMRKQVDEKSMGPANNMPSILSKVGIAQHLNEQLPLNLTFVDDQGKQVQLSDYFGRIPAILALVYYRCPMLCSEELDGLTSALQMVNYVPGKDFNIIVVSIDPSEGPDLAAAKKRSYLKRYGHPETAAGWHFLTGTQPNIDALTQAVGFRYARIPGPDGKLTQFAHASSIEIVTTDGKLAQYYMGVEYSPKDMILGLDEASSNRIGSPVENILTYCYHYDPQTNTHSLIVARIVQLGGFVTVLMLGGFMFLMLRKDYRQAHQSTPATNVQEPKVNG